MMTHLRLLYILKKLIQIKKLKEVMSRSVCDEEFLNAGKTDGICIWRIEDFKLIKLKPVEYGNIFLRYSF